MKLLLKSQKSAQPSLIFIDYIIDTCVQPTPQKLIYIAVGPMPNLYNGSSLIVYDINFGVKDN